MECIYKSISGLSHFKLCCLCISFMFWKFLVFFFSCQNFLRASNSVISIWISDPIQSFSSTSDKTSFRSSRTKKEPHEIWQNTKQTHIYVFHSYHKIQDTDSWELFTF